MFFGQIGVGLATKPVAPKVPLGAAPQLFLLPGFDFLLLPPLGNSVDRHRAMAAASARQDA